MAKKIEQTDIKAVSSPILKHPFNYSPDEDFVGNVMITTEPSVTVPDMSLTVNDILQRHVRGTLNDIEKTPYYDDDIDIDADDPTIAPGFDIFAAYDYLDELKFNEKWKQTHTTSQEQNIGSISKQDNPAPAPDVEELKS